MEYYLVKLKESIVKCENTTYLVDTNLKLGYVIRGRISTR